MKKMSLFVTALLIASCAGPKPNQLVQLVEQASTVSLWSTYASSSDAILISMIETELISRGQSKFGTTYVGQRTSAAYGRQLYQRSSVASQSDVSDSSADLFNCSDFASSLSAQRFLLESGGPINDPNNLDADGDGLAREWGVEFKTAARIARTPVVTTPRYTAPSRSYSRCYVGPRGGTYTITSGGSRDYNGC